MVRCSQERGAYTIPVMSEYAAQFKLRLSYELKKQLEVSAREGARSLTAEILLRLERSFEPDMRVCMALRAELVAARALAHSAIDVMSRKNSAYVVNDAARDMDPSRIDSASADDRGDEDFEAKTLQWLQAQNDATTVLLAELAYADAVGKPMSLELVRCRITELDIHLPQD